MKLLSTALAMILMATPLLADDRFPPAPFLLNNGDGPADRFDDDFRDRRADRIDDRRDDFDDDDFRERRADRIEDRIDERYDRGPIDRIEDVRDRRDHDWDRDRRNGPWRIPISN